MVMQSDEQKPYFHFIVLWVGLFISCLGSGLSGFALGVYAFHLSGSAAAYSLVILAAFLPSIILKPFGGVLADRMDRRLLMIIGDIGSIVGMLFIILMIELGVKALWPIYIGSIISSVFVSVHNPAFKACVTDLLNEEQFSKASGLIQLTESSKLIIAPIIAGFLLSFLSIQHILAIDCVSFLIAILTVFWIKKQIAHRVKAPSKQKHFLADLHEGFVYTLRHRPLFVLLCVGSLITFAIGFLQALLGPMILSFSTAKVFGVVQTLAASGMLFSSLLIGLFSKSQQSIKKIALFLFLAGLFFALIGISPKIVWITIFAFLFFICLPFVNTGLDVLIRSNVENNMQGRVWAIVSLISQLGMLIALGIAGFIADHVANPLLMPGGGLASSLGQLIGTGPGRGIGFIFILSGLLLCMVAFILSRLSILSILDKACAKVMKK